MWQPIVQIYFIEFAASAFQTAAWQLNIILNSK